MGTKLNFEYEDKTISKDTLKNLLDMIKNIEYGSVTINIQNGHIIQIDKNEKIRIK